MPATRVFAVFLVAVLVVHVACGQALAPPYMRQLLYLASANQTCDDTQPTEQFLQTGVCAFDAAVGAYTIVQCTAGASSATVKACQDSSCETCGIVSDVLLPSPCTPRASVLGGDTKYSVVFESCIAELPRDTAGAYVMRYAGESCRGPARLISATSMACFHNADGIFSATCNSRREVVVRQRCNIGCSSCEAVEAQVVTNCRTVDAVGPDGIAFPIAEQNQCTSIPNDAAALVFPPLQALALPAVLALAWIL